LRSPTDEMFWDQGTAALLLATLIAFVHGWSTGSLIISLVRSSGGSRCLTCAVVLGGLTGTVIGGRFVTHTVLLGGAASAEGLMRVLFITFLLLLLGSITATPISYSHVLVLTAIGEILGSGVAIEQHSALYLIMGWIVGPFIASVLTIATHSSMRRLVSNLGLLTVSTMNRLSLYVISFFTTYVVAGNNMGFLASLVEKGGWPIPHLVIALSWALGALFPGKVIWDYIADRVVRVSPQGVFSAAVWSSATMLVFLHLSVPTSISHYILASAALLPLQASLHVIGWRAVVRVVVWSSVTSILGFTAAWLLRLG
jgi:phosphate/sulfate permease